MFLLVRLLLGEHSPVGEFLKRFVATPLLVLGGVCLVVLWLGRWLKRVAGEAAETLQRTSEAHFISLLQMQKTRDEEADIAFLARRVFRQEPKPEHAQWAVCRQLAAIRRGAPWDGTGLSEPLHEDVNRVALLYLHFVDGAILHQTDVKTTEQLLANLSLENIRSEHLRYTARDRKRVRRLSLAEGATLTGPYLWFRCITESIAIETAKRVIDYNRRCLTLRRYAQASEEERRAMDAWLAARCADPRGRSIERHPAPNAGVPYVTTEFNTLDFLSIDAGREQHITEVFGARVLEVVRAERRRMIREIFGTRRLDRLPRSKRILNFYALYMRRLSRGRRGRILFLPLLWVRLMFRAVAMCIGNIVEMVREITRPERADLQRESGVASFSVARRKIHRMKAPGLLEAMMMRAAFDPAYSGAPTCWSRPAAREHPSELERDMDFLGLPQHARAALRARSAAVCREVQRCHFRMRELPPLGARSNEAERDLGETAVTIAWVTDRDGMRTLLTAEQWFAEERRAIEAGAVAPPSRAAACLRWLWRGGGAHPVDAWLPRIAPGPVSERVRRCFAAAYDRGDSEVRAAVRAFRELPEGTPPEQRALDIARAAFTHHGEVSRELAALRAVQSLSVLDVRNYARLVFHLGDYAGDGESPALAEALP
jgi:hypothetical protein